MSHSSLGSINVDTLFNYVAHLSLGDESTLLPEFEEADAIFMSVALETMSLSQNDDNNYYMNNGDNCGGGDGSISGGGDGSVSGGGDEEEDDDVDDQDDVMTMMTMMTMMTTTMTMMMMINQPIITQILLIHQLLLWNKLQNKYLKFHIFQSSFLWHRSWYWEATWILPWGIQWPRPASDWRFPEGCGRS